MNTRIDSTETNPQGKQASQGLVSELCPTEILITSYRGPLEVSYLEEMLVIPEGTTYKVTQVRGGQGGPDPVGAGEQAARLAQLHAILVGTASSGAILSAVTIANTQERKLLVSSSVP